MDMSDIGEFGFIDRLQQWVMRGSAPIGIGDDAAVLSVSAGTSLVVSTDAMVEGVHFKWSWSSPEDVGWKSVSTNVSDLAAMGADPRYVLVALAVPSSTPEAKLAGLYAGIAEACAEYGVEVVGGDIVRSDRSVISVTAIGEVEGEPLRRSGAEVGDVLVTTGPVGKAATGLNLLLGNDPTRTPPSDALACIAAHRRPRARVDAGRELRIAGATAAIDLSDGLAGDARRLAEASGAGVEIDVVPIAPEAESVSAARGWDAETIALRGGEDYELLATISPERAAEVEGLIVIGRVVEDGVWLVRQGERIPLGSDSYDHFRVRP